ncbi:flagellar hook-associated protein FlgL [Salinibacillus xinjiangensis]|uniref:Flagellar hook-associated protein FlgL n=1 Tax=Salinibacillus xinjiangensis TaxID=1229268 RepID=A0A6G1X1M8_9BACI|nr:flagellar hook-associated protein FlgL [Salinibacillus xinjiangensis]MRG84785.1 flagellar hook-associated protein FlgL [Salinibacillus xinjiangensis]
MRVTQSMLSNNFMRNLSGSYERMAKYQEQLYTGKKVSRPSDDPVVAMKGMNYRTELTEIKQYQRNLGEIHNWMSSSDDAMDKATKTLQRLRELATQASNDTYEGDQRANIAQEVEQLRDHLIDISNTKVNNKYIFNGTDTTNPRFNENGELIAGNANNDAVNIAVSDGIVLKANTNPSNMFTEELFDNIQSFADDLKAGKTGKDLDNYIKDIDGFINDVVDERANLGARMNRLDMVEDRLSSQEITATQIMSDNEDADIEKVIMNLKTQESIHRAALSTGARIIQPSLIDFLR